MKPAVVKARSTLRDNLAAISAANPPAARLTSLGMHYLPAPDETPVLVTVEINMSRLLAILRARVFKSKRGQASMGKGSVRVSVATPDGLEVLGALQAASPSLPDSRATLQHHV